MNLIKVRHRESAGHNKVNILGWGVEQLGNMLIIRVLMIFLLKPILSVLSIPLYHIEVAIQ